MKTKRFKLNIMLYAIMFLLLSFCLCGCASVNLVTYHDSNGMIYEYVYLTIDEQSLTSNGYNVNDVKLEIQTNSYLEASTLLQQYQNTIANEYQLENLSSNEYSTLFEGVKIAQESWKDNVYMIGFRFNNSNIYKKYYELMNGVTFNNNTKEVKKLFYTKTFYYGTANYGDYSIFNKIYNYYANSIFATFSPQETNLTYSYSVTSKRFHSDANRISLDSKGNYIHTWNIDPNNPAREIYFYTISANRGIWLISCIITGLIISIILSIVGLIKYFKNKIKNNLNN